MPDTTIDGIYAIYITGQSGNSLVLIMMKNGKVTGVDPMGTMFDGDYSPAASGQGYQVNVTVKIHPEGMTVQGVSAGPSGLTYEVNYVLPENFQQQEFLEINTPLGKVNAKFKKLRDLLDA